MMFNKRLTATVSGSRKYVAGNVALQWCALAANTAMIGALCRLLERVFLRSAGAGDLLLTARCIFSAMPGDVLFAVARAAVKRTQRAGSGG